MSSYVMLFVIVLFGSSTFFRKLAVDGMSPYHLQVVAGIIYASLIPLWLWFAPRAPLPSCHSIAAAAAAVLTNVTGAVLFGFLLKRTSDVTVLSSLASASPVVTALLAIFFLGEPVTLTKAIGAALILLGAALCNR